MVLFVMIYSIITFAFFDKALYPEGAFVHLQLPNYFRIELTIAKTLGVLALLIPSVPLKVKEFAYFGFAITLVSASHRALRGRGRRKASFVRLLYRRSVDLPGVADRVLPVLPQVEKAVICRCREVRRNRTRSGSTSSRLAQRAKARR